MLYVIVHCISESINVSGQLHCGLTKSGGCEIVIFIPGLSRSRLLKWTPITITELQGFLAIVINMGIISVPAIEDYWKTSWIAEVPFFSRVMPRDRFMLILWMLHVSHSTVSPPKRIDKIKLFLELMLTRFQANYAPQRSLAIDETMLRFRGRFAGKQYMPKKPVKWGIKAFSLADSSNGYLLNILLYTGAETLDGTNHQFSTLPQPAHVVMHLLEPTFIRDTTFH